MLLTEEQAKKTACCKPNEASTCQATRCMAWRWINYKRPTSPISIRDRLGYCGLACSPINLIDDPVG